MNKVYNIATPPDFLGVIADIVSWKQAHTEGSLVLTLVGDLGAGKTTFTQVFGRYLGVEEVITSPTFTIMKQYALDHELFDTLVHIDAYRLETIDEVKPLRLSEVFGRDKILVCVEWPERIAESLPKNVVAMEITHTEGETRQVTVHYPESGSER